MSSNVLRVFHLVYGFERLLISHLRLHRLTDSIEATFVFHSACIRGNVHIKCKDWTYYIPTNNSHESLAKFDQSQISILILNIIFSWDEYAAQEHIMLEEMFTEPLGHV